VSVKFNDFWQMLTAYNKKWCDANLKKILPLSCWKMHGILMTSNLRHYYIVLYK